MHTVKQQDDKVTLHTLFHMYSLMWIMIQPDESGKVCEGAYLVQNSFHKKTPDDKTSRQLDHIDIEPITIGFTGIVTKNDKTRALGQLLLDRAMLSGVADPANLPITNTPDGKDILPESNLPATNPTTGVTPSYQSSVDATRD